VRVSVDISPDISEPSVPGAPSSPASGAAWHAVLRLTDLEQHTVTHEVEDSSCSALVRALGLLVALQADAAPEPKPSGVALAPARFGADSSAAAPFDATVSRAAREKEADAFQVSAVVLARYHGALAPEPAVGIGVGAALEWAGEGWWVPRFELSLARLGSAAMQLPGEVTLRFDALLASVSACPLRVLGGQTWALWPCADLEVGQLTGHGGGRAVVRAEPRRAPWLAPGLSLRAHVAPFGGPVQLGTAVGASVPLYRHDFFFAPDLEGFAVPPVGWNAAGTLAWLF
jgi:hypothetical protein